MLREIITPYFIWGVILFEGRKVAGIPDVSIQLVIRANSNGSQLGYIQDCTTERGADYEAISRAENVKYSRYIHTYKLSSSSSVYNSSNTVTPLSESVIFCIKH